MNQEYTKQERFLDWLGGNDIVFYILSFTWGSLASIIGLIILIPFLITKKVKIFCNRVYGIFPKCFGSGWGFEMGCFFFTSYDCDNEEQMLCHESGHGLQNILWGPLMLFVISIPSVIRFWYREYKYKKGAPLPPYDSIWFEGQASRWGLNHIYYVHCLKGKKK